MHIPRTGRTALGAQAAVHAKILVLDHDSSRLRQVRRHIQRLLVIFGGRRQACSQIVFFAVLGDRQAVDRTDIETGIALDTEIGVKRFEYRNSGSARPPDGLLCCKPELDLDIEFLEALL